MGIPADLLMQNPKITGFSINPLENIISICWNNIAIMGE
jgi:hypothetical protein